MQPIAGLHHVTAIAGPAQENLDFYAGVLGMRLDFLIKDCQFYKNRKPKTLIFDIL